MHNNESHDRERALIHEALSNARSVAEIHAALVRPSVPTVVRARYALAVRGELGRLARLGVLEQLAGTKYAARRLLSHAQVLCSVTSASVNGNAAAGQQRLDLDRNQTTLIREAVIAGRAPEEILATLTAGYADANAAKAKALLLRHELLRLDATGTLAQVACWEVAAARYIVEIAFRCQELEVEAVSEKPRRRRRRRNRQRPPREATAAA
jgi:hypothetical protein